MTDIAEFHVFKTSERTRALIEELARAGRPPHQPPAPAGHTLIGPRYATASLPDDDYAGWHWKCSCGTEVPWFIGNWPDSEAEALQQWQEHVKDTAAAGVPEIILTALRGTVAAGAGEVILVPGRPAMAWLGSLEYKQVSSALDPLGLRDALRHLVDGQLIEHDDIAFEFTRFESGGSFRIPPGSRQ